MVERVRIWIHEQRRETRLILVLRERLDNACHHKRMRSNPCCLHCVPNSYGEMRKVRGGVPPFGGGGEVRWQWDACKRLVLHVHACVRIRAVLWPLCVEADWQKTREGPLCTARRSAPHDARRPQSQLDVLQIGDDLCAQSLCSFHIHFVNVGSCEVVDHVHLFGLVVLHDQRACAPR